MRRLDAPKPNRNNKYRKVLLVNISDSVIGIQQQIIDTPKRFIILITELL